MKKHIPLLSPTIQKLHKVGKECIYMWTDQKYIEIEELVKCNFNYDEHLQYLAS